MNEAQERYAETMRKLRQAEAKEDAHFARQVSDVCHWCGCVHRTRAEYHKCLTDNIG